MMPQYWDVTTPDQLQEFLEHVEARKYKGERVWVKFKEPENHRTLSQNAALHKWLTDVANTLNDAGYSVMTTLRHDAEIPWTQHSAKELLWRPVQVAMTGKESSTEPTKLEYPDISETIIRHLSERTGVTLPPWPTRDL